MTTRQRMLVLSLGFCFAIVIATSAAAGHYAVAFAFTALALLALGIHGPSKMRIGRMPLLVLGAIASASALGVVLATGVA